MIDAIHFKQSLMNRQLPEGLALHLQALWYDGTGDWKTAAHVHAYLHRKEGDIWNADYWYNRAGKQRPQISLDEEWESLVALYSQ